MSLLSICREAAAEAGVAPPAGIVGSAETTAVRLLAAARQEIFSMAESADWSALVAEHRFAAAARTAQPDGLPADFARIVDGTAWDRAGARPLDGPLSAQRWQTLRASGAGPAARRGFRIFGGVFHLQPAPAEAGAEIAFEYVTRDIVAAASGARRRTWEADGDGFVLSEEIATMGVKWRFKKALGLAYDDDLDEYLAVLARAIARDGGRPILRADGAIPPFPAAATPEGDFPEA